MIRLDVENNGRKNICYNKDANTLISEIEGDILYLDPPYNSRQYVSNYHLLETISRYDSPEIKGVTGVRNYKEQKSAFCVKKEALKALEEIIEKANFENIVLSYSNEGLMTFDEIEKILKKYGMPKTYKRYDIPYRKYKSKITKEEKILYEYIFFIKKNIKPKQTSRVAEDEFAYEANTAGIHNNRNRKFVKSPLNYIGGKYKLLPQILPYFPKSIDTFVDLFSGGANVGINVDAEKIICNDINTKIIEMFNAFKVMELDEILKAIDKNIETYNLSKTNENGFLRFRASYNKKPDPIALYTLACYSFNYQFRFNNKHEYNNPFGRNRSQFSDKMRMSLISFVNKLKSKNIVFAAKVLRM